MAWKGTFFGALIGFFATHSVWGAVLGAAIGQMLDNGSVVGFASATEASSAAISEVFFRVTFEFMGHVAKSDGRVSEAEIEAARRLMQALMLGPHETSAAIACFRSGKAADYAAAVGVERLRTACGARHDLLRAFMELQLRAALAGNGISPPARTILRRAAERLGISDLQFAQMESAVRGRQQGEGGFAGPTSQSMRMAQCYAELEADAGISDKELTKAYRRQMSRHHPDKLVANGLPESMAQIAKEKTQRIQEAYGAIRAARGMK